MKFVIYIYKLMTWGVNKGRTTDQLKDSSFFYLAEPVDYVYQTSCRMSDLINPNKSHYRISIADFPVYSWWKTPKYYNYLYIEPESYVPYYSRYTTTIWPMGRIVGTDSLTFPTQTKEYLSTWKFIYLYSGEGYYIGIASDYKLYVHGDPDYNNGCRFNNWVKLNDVTTALCIIRTSYRWGNVFLIIDLDHNLKYCPSSGIEISQCDNLKNSNNIQYINKVLFNNYIGPKYTNIHHFPSITEDLRSGNLYMTLNGVIVTVDYSKFPIGVTTNLYNGLDSKYMDNYSSNQNDYIVGYFTQMETRGITDTVGYHSISILPRYPVINSYLDEAGDDYMFLFFAFSYDEYHKVPLSAINEYYHFGDPNRNLQNYDVLTDIVRVDNGNLFTVPTSIVEPQTPTRQLVDYYYSDY